MPRRPVLPLVILAWCGACIQAQEASITGEPVKFPRTIQQTIEQALTEVAKSRQQYDKAAKAVADKLVVILKKEQDAATKAGQLDLAVALKQRIKEIEDGDLADLADHQAKAARGSTMGAVAGDAINPKKAIVGIWTWNLIKAQFTPDGLVTIQGVNLTGTWSVDRNGKTIRLSWGGQYGDSIEFINPDTVTVTNGKGEQTIARRVVEVKPR